MDVSAIDNVFATKRVTRISALVAGSGVSDTGAIGEAQFQPASIVTLSPLSQLLAATAVFQAQQSNGSATSTAFADFANAANLFVNAFNNFQNSLTGSASPFELAFGTALSQALQTQGIQSGAGATQTLINSLAGIGINYQPSADGVTPGQLQIDWTALETAFNANPVQTSRLLSNAFQLLNSIEQNLSSQTGADQYLFAPQFGLLNSAFGQNAYAAVQSFVANDSLTTMFGLTQTTGQTSTTANANAAQNQTQSTATAINLPLIAAPSQPLLITGPAADVSVITTPSAQLATPIAASSTNLTPTANQAVVNPNPGAMPIDPLVLTAVASYRLGEAVANNRSDVRYTTPELADDDVAPVDKPGPVALDLHQGEGRQ